VNFLPISQTELITSVLAAPKGTRKKETPGFLVMVTKQGVVKKVEANEFENVRRSGLIAITLKGNDELGWVRLTSGANDISVVTKQGQSIRFSEKDVRAMGRSAAGVGAIRIKKNDEVVGMDVIRETGANLIIVTSQGFGKQTPLKQYKKQRRGGSGIKTAKVTPKNGHVIGTHVIEPDETELVAISKKGQVIRTQLSAIPVQGRATQGVRIIRLEGGDHLASFTT
jgi:DNA gyrase subunit A